MAFGVLAGLTLVALLAVFIGFLVGLLLIGAVIYIAGKAIVGRKATLGGAIAVAFLGIVLGAIIGLIFPVIGWILALLVWVYLVKRYFDCGWLAALGISVLAVVIWIIIWVILATVVGIALFAFL